MTAAEMETSKRKRKHSKKAAVPEAPTNGAAPVEKARKKVKKQHTPEPEPEVEAENAVAEASAESEEDESALNEELKSIVADAKAAKADQNEDEDEDEDEEQAQPTGANAEDLPSGTSIPMEGPKLFSDLNLSERTMNAIKSMGFENMTEIQQKTIPPLLR
jgi:ATP-dependent RNA helicase DDX18/HAS1